MPKQVRGVHHIILTVADPARSDAFYRRILGVEIGGGNENIRWISCDTFLLAFQRAPHKPIPNDRFDENRVGLDHFAFAVDSRKQLEDLLILLKEMNIPTAGIEFDPDGKEEYVCFRDPDNIQLEFYVGDYRD
ncbi:MAG: VOC family protein [Anaerolineales bacterium]|uniref:VOC family protein n=1 Tax=Candidatus Villigracilis vicinus TaxID=3140679 RepID=UPI003136D0F0|nr:VOC family protein [Anaerolineales bacterium]